MQLHMLTQHVGTPCVVPNDRYFQIGVPMATPMPEQPDCWALAADLPNACPWKHVDMHVKGAKEGNGFDHTDHAYMSLGMGLTA